MTKKNCIKFNDDVLKDIENSLDRLLEMAKPFTTPLTNKSRRKLFKMGEKSYAFGAKSFEFAKKFPEMFPGYLDLSEFCNAHEDNKALLAPANKAKQLFDLLNDTRTTSGSDVMSQSLAFYNHIVMLAKMNVPGARIMHEELKKRFPYNKKRNRTDAITTEDSSMKIAK
jgi:hypothetical protein